MKNYFLQITSSFLYCSIDNSPFKFLGVQVGSSHIRVSLWRKVVDIVRQKLSSWKGRYLYIGGRFVMINDALNYILIYYFFTKLQLKF